MKNLEEFQDLKFGLLLHWGVYSVLGVTESWAFFKNEMSYEDYMKQCESFTAKNYAPEHWADLFEKAGVKYCVLTTKHHDGVALWDTKANDFSVVNKTPAGRDLIGPYCDALRARGIQIGLYYSHLDWSHPDYASIHPNATEWWTDSVYTAPKGPDDLERWNRFLQFHRDQLTELMTNYGPIDVMWFDGDWGRTDEQWKFKEVRDHLKSLNPEVIINSRMGDFGDYATPEQGVPIVPPEGPWELNMTWNDSWMYTTKDTNYKSLRQIIRTFTECLSMGGNFLLGLGPREDGTFDEKQEQLLLDIGAWMKKHSEAIYGTRAGLPHGHFCGSTTLSKDQKTLYLFFYDIPVDQICVKGICNDVKKVTVLGENRELTHQKIGGFISVPGILWIDVPNDVVDPTCTVIKVELDSPLNLYTGKGNKID